MFGISPQELLLILVVALIVVGPKRLPELGRSLGKGLREIRKAQDEVRRTVQVNLEEEPPAGRQARGPDSPPEGANDGERPADADSGTAAAATGAAASVSEISKTLGRGLGELRRARDEVERSFRVDLNAPDSPRTPSTTPTTPSAAEEASEPTSDGASDERGPE